MRYPASRAPAPRSGNRQGSLAHQNIARGGRSGRARSRPPIARLAPRVTRARTRAPGRAFQPSAPGTGARRWRFAPLSHRPAVQGRRRQGMLLCGRGFPPDPEKRTRGGGGEFGCGMDVVGVVGGFVETVGAQRERRNKGKRLVWGGNSQKKKAKGNSTLDFKINKTKNKAHSFRRGGIKPIKTKQVNKNINNKKKTNGGHGAGLVCRC